MFADPSIHPAGFPNWPGVWEALFAHLPQTACFLQQQLAHVLEGTEAKLTIYRRTVLLSVLPELVNAAEIAGLRSSLIEQLTTIGIQVSNTPVDICDVCQLLQSIGNADKTIPRQKKELASTIHVSQLHLRERRQFLVPPLSIVLQSIRLLLSSETMQPLSVQLLTVSRPVEIPGAVQVTPVEIPGKCEQRAFLLNGESATTGFSAFLLAIAACSIKPEDVPSDLVMWLSALPVRIDTSCAAEEALLTNHVHNMISNALRKPITEWDHYDFLENYRSLSCGDDTKGLKALNDRLKEPSLRINLRQSRRLASLLDRTKTPEEFRGKVNEIRQLLDDDDAYLPYSRSLLNQSFFYMKSSLLKSTGLTKLMYTLEKTSFLLVADVIAWEWKEACLGLSHDQDTKWPKPPSVPVFEQHRFNIACFHNLVCHCLEEPFSTQLWNLFAISPRKFYPQLLNFRKEFEATVHDVNDADSRSWPSFLLQLSRQHFSVIDDHFKLIMSSELAQKDTVEREARIRDTSKRTSECAQVLETELQEALGFVQDYDTLVTKLNVDNKSAQQKYDMALEEEKKKLLGHVTLHPIGVTSTDEDRDRFSMLDSSFKRQIEVLRAHICSTTGLPENDVYILVNLNFGLKRANCLQQAKKIGNQMRTDSVLRAHDAVLYRPLEWVSATDDAHYLRREIRDALFGPPVRGSTPAFHTTELSLSRGSPSKKGGGQHVQTRINAVFAKKATGKRNQKEYVRADDWLEVHDTADLWGSELLWATTCMLELPLNESGIWNKANKSYMSAASASKKDRMSSSGVSFDAEIFARLCQGPLDAKKAVGIYDPCAMLGLIVALVSITSTNCCHLLGWSSLYRYVLD